MKKSQQVHRDKNVIWQDFIDSKENFSYNKKLIIFCLSIEIVLIYLYNYFVLNVGTKFDHILSILVLLFFGVVILYNIKNGKKNYSEMKFYQREYKIATETPEQKQVRERSEKFNRILKKSVEE